MDAELEDWIRQRARAKPQQDIDILAEEIARELRRSNPSTYMKLDDVAKRRGLNVAILISGFLYFLE